MTPGHPQPAAGPPGGRREVRCDAQGVPVLTYELGWEDDRPRADDVAVVGPDPVGLILAEMSGWVVACPPELGRQLVGQGAQLVHHGHTMRRPLRGDPAVRTWADLDLGVGRRAVPCDRDAREVFPAWRAAFSSPGHPDRHPGTDEQALAERLVPLLDGAVGPLLPWSALVVDADDRVVAGLVAVDFDGRDWIADLFRQPGPRHAGLGTLLLRRCLAAAAAAGATEVGLSVTEGNPARRGYERLGFQLVRTSVTVVVP